MNPTVRSCSAALGPSNVTYNFLGSSSLVENFKESKLECHTVTTSSNFKIPITLIKLLSNHSWPPHRSTPRTLGSLHCLLRSYSHELKAAAKPLQAYIAEGLERPFRRKLELRGPYRSQGIPRTTLSVRNGTNVD